MGLIVLHAGHNADLFKKLMGTSCKHKWREANDHERLWVVAPGHPIAAGLGEYVDIGPEEMYGEHFDVLPAEALVFVGWFSGGEVFRSGCSCQHTLQTISMPSPLLSSDASELPSDTMPTAPILICLAHRVLALGDQERVTKLYPRLLAFHGQHYLFLVDRILGEMATLCEDWKAARMHLTAANAVAQREDLRHELARTLLAQADFEVACGGQGSEIRARDMLNLALVLFEEQNMTTSIDRVRRRLCTLPHQPCRSTLRPLPANLTTREVKVLQLVTSGKSNSKIAKELGITEKTVANHLYHIFNKKVS